jgi:tRNA (pseudouridine54-N1)-methyltransferase
MRRFVVVGRDATASDAFSLEDLPGTSGRLDVGLRCLRAALLVSHGLRRDVVVYLVLGGGPRAPRVLRVRGEDARFLRPDERSLAVLAKKALAGGDDESENAGFVERRPGVAVARGGVACVVADVGSASLYVLEEGARDLRQAPAFADDVVFFLGDPGGFDESVRRQLASLGATSLSIGPVGVHAEDAVAVVSNELDRRG